MQKRCIIREMPSLGTGFSDAPLRLRPELDELGMLTGHIEAFAEQHGWAMADAMAFTLAAEELFANTLRHGLPAAQAIELSLSDEDGVGTAVYVDDGHEFDPTEMPEVDLNVPVEQRRIGGLGIHFIRRTMPIFQYRREGNRNVITFGRTLGEAAR